MVPALEPTHPRRTPRVSWDSSSVRNAPETAAGGSGAGAPGRRNPEADRRRPADRSASFAIAPEVALVESAVCALISFNTCMLRAIACAAAVWERALAEMFCTRLAI